MVLLTKELHVTGKNYNTHHNLNICKNCKIVSLTINEVLLTIKFLSSAQTST